MKEEYIADLATQNNILQKLNFTLKDKIADLKSQVNIIHKTKSDLKLRHSDYTEKSSILAKKMQEINELLQVEETKPNISLRRIPKETTDFQKIQKNIPRKTYQLCVDQTKSESEYRNSEPFSLIQVDTKPQIEGLRNV